MNTAIRPGALSFVRFFMLVQCLCSGGVKPGSERQFFQLHFAEKEEGGGRFAMSQVTKAIRFQVFKFLLEKHLQKKLQIAMSSSLFLHPYFICVIS